MGQLGVVLVIVTIDTEDIARRMLEDGSWTLEDFADGDAPMGWTNELVDLVPEYEDAVYRDVLRLLKSK